jgi:uncharacterized protein
MMHQDFWGPLGEALLMAAGMFWNVGWSLVLGFMISAVIQAVVSTEQMRRALGRDGVREIALATVAGAVSSNCSYASAAIPEPNSNIRAELTTFSFNYTFWLNLAFGALATYFAWLNWQHPMDHGHYHGTHHADDHGASQTVPTPRRPEGGP